MYRITPKKGEPFIVNHGHVLSLKTTNEGKADACSTTGREVENVTVGEWLSRSKSWKHLRKLRRSAVEFPGLAVPAGRSELRLAVGESWRLWAEGAAGRGAPRKPSS